MAENDGHTKEEGELVKKCPFQGGWCIKDACAIYEQVTQVRGGLLKKFGVCTFVATNMMLSEMNTKTQLPAPKMAIPPLFRG